jgi:4-nitrophenyl phosphatase
MGLRGAGAFAAVKAVVFDLDGTLVRGPEALPGAVAALERLRASGLRIAFCTQDSMQSPAAIAARLAGLGFGAGESDVLSAGWSAAHYLSRRFQGERIALFCGDGLRDAFTSLGAEIVDARDGGRARALYMARKPNFSAQDLAGACACIWNGAEFFAVCTDRVLPTKGGDLPGAGAAVRGVEFATRTRAKILGKPSLPLAEAIMRRMDLAPDEILMVGDQVDSDIRLGKNAKWRTALVLTGGTDAARANRLGPKLAPDSTLPDVAALPALFAEAVR